MRKIRHSSRWLVVILLIITCLQLVACAQAASDEEGNGPARIEKIEGKDISRVILTKEAVDRLGIETTKVIDEQVQGATRLVVPYSAILYDLNGASWVFKNPEANTYEREAVTIDFIDKDIAVLSKGPSPGTVIVKVGAPELYGAEIGVGGENG